MAQLGFNKGHQIAKIDIPVNGIIGDKNYTLKVKEPDRKNFYKVNENEDFGEQDKYLSLYERFPNLPEKYIKKLIKLNPAILNRLHNEADNDECDFLIKQGNQIEEKHCRFRPTINPNIERNVYYIFGASGDGKSTIARNLAKEYLLEFPENHVFLFTLKESDPAFDDISSVIRVPMDEDILSEIELDTLNNSLCIFDDFEAEAKELEEARNLMDAILQRGRSKRIYCIITTHMAANYKKTRVVLNEVCTMITFPKRVSYRNFEYLFKNYMGLDKKLIDKLWNTDSRWVLYNKKYPQYVLYENGCYLC